MIFAPSDWRQRIQRGYPPPDHQEQVECDTLYLTYISPANYGVYWTYWNTNPRVPYGERLHIYTDRRQGGD